MKANSRVIPFWRYVVFQVKNMGKIGRKLDWSCIMRRDCNRKKVPLIALESEPSKSEPLESGTVIPRFE
jgi:hypothetical protein